MAPRGYDRYMLVVGSGRNRKFVRLSDSERCAHFLGVLSIAAQSSPRGYLLVADGHEAGAEEVANEAGGGVTVRIARAAMEKLRRVGVLEWDAELDAWRVRHWDDVNPPPKRDESAAERQRRRRERLRLLEGRDGTVTEGVSHDDVTRDTPPGHAPEVEGEVEVEAPTGKSNAELRSAVIEIFSYWQEECNHPQAAASEDRLSKIRARLKERQAIHRGDLHRAILDCRQAIEGAARAAYVDERGVRHDGIGLIFRNNERLEDFMGRAVLPAGGKVVPLRPSQTPVDPVQKALSRQKLTRRGIWQWVRNGLEDPAEIRALIHDFDESVDLEAEIAAAKEAVRGDVGGAGA